MFEFAGELETPINFIFLAVTGFIAVHAIRPRKGEEKGSGDFVRLLFGCIAATFFFLVLFQDVLGVVNLTN
ncbi:MAG: hypothetical protein QNJ92_03615 [Alphaproteobacteria bacterium]|nr:hypothetical protein [Alphaproteobacteria bacterium]